MTTALRQAQRVLKDAPCSTRALAQAAGLSPALLSRILNGERSLTPATAAALATGLEEWSDRCAKLAREMRTIAGTLATGKGV